MRETVVERQIEAPLQRVWALATDIERGPDVLPSIDKVEVVERPAEETGPFPVGLRWRETRTINGRQATEEMVVTGVEPGQSYTVEAESDGVHYISTFDFAEDGHGTTVRLTFGGTPVTRSAKIFSPLAWALMGRQVRRALEQDLADLATAAEGQAAGSADDSA